MIFVNDLADASSAPFFLRHLPDDADGLSVADLVFPAFLFIAGMSIPLSLSARMQAVSSRVSLIKALFLRGMALLAMGFVMVTGEAHEPWPNHLWSFLSYVCMFLCFSGTEVSGSSWGRFLSYAKPLGALGLLALLILHRDLAGNAPLLGPLMEGGGDFWFNHSWWGILGLIAWAWFFSSIIYLFFGSRREWLLGACLIAILLGQLVNAEVIVQMQSRAWLVWCMPFLDLLGGLYSWIDGHLGLGSLGPLVGLTLAGVCLGSALGGPQALARPKAIVQWALVFALGLALTGFLLDAPLGISKIRATPAFALYCAALSTFAWLALYWIVEIRGCAGWFSFLQPAGSSPLLAYLLHPFLCLSVGLFGAKFESTLFFYRSFGPWGACIGAFLFAWLVLKATALCTQVGYRLKV